MLRKLHWSLRFALSEIRCEWLFGFGVALAVSSVLTPSALLWGTKTGMIDTMRNRLLRDPAIMELVGEENSAIPAAWFHDMRADPRVSFVIPSVRRISLYGDVSMPDGSTNSKSDVAYLPTAAGDPVGGGVDLDPGYVGGPVPCMVAAVVAEPIGAEQGDRIVIALSRIENGAVAKVTLEAIVSRILSPGESNAKAVFLPLPVIERIEDYKDGRAVPVFGWKGNFRESLRTYDSMRVKLGRSENAESLAAALRSLSQFKNIKILGAPEAGNLELVSTGDGIGHAEMLEMARVFSAFEPRILLQAEAAFEFSTSGAEAGLKDGILAADLADWLTPKDLEEIEVDLEQPFSDSTLWTLKIQAGGNGFSTLRISLPKPEKTGAMLRVPRRIVGVIGAAKRQQVEYNGTTGEFRPVRREYPGFRLYARNLEDVKPLRMKCAEEGIQVRTNEDRIQSVVYLDNALGKFLAFIVVAGSLGGVGALFTSLYLSIERSRRQFAVLQILGIPVFYVFLSTLLQAVFMVLAGAVASFAFFQIGAWLLTAVLSSGVEPSGRMCELRFWQWAVLVGASLLSALLATLLALGRLRFRDPAVVARSE